MQYKNFFFLGLLITLILPLQVLGVKITYYIEKPSYEAPGSCGREFLYEYYIALNAKQLDTDKSYYCGKCVKIVYENKYFVGRINDRCEGCPYGGLDINPTIIDYFIGSAKRIDLGVIYANWSIVSCDEYGKKGKCSSSGCDGSSSDKVTTTTKKKITTTTTKKITTTTTKKKITTTTKKTTTTTNVYIPPPPLSPSSSPSPSSLSQSTIDQITPSKNVTTETQANDKPPMDEILVEINPVFDNDDDNADPREVKEDKKKKGGNAVNYVVPVTGTVMVSVAGVGLIYMKKKNKKVTLYSHLKSITRSVTTRGSSIGRNVTRSITTRGSSIGRNMTRSHLFRKKPAPPTLPTSHIGSKVIDVNQPTESSMY